MATFALLIGEKVLNVYSFNDTKKSITVGRHEYADVPIPNRAISRRHARILPNGEGWLVEDMGARNGIYFQGRRIQEKILSEGDEIYLGKYALKFLGEQQENQEHGFKTGDGSGNDEPFAAADLSDFHDTTMETVPHDLARRRRLEEERRIPRFEVVVNGKVVSMFRLRNDKLTIGRDEQCNIQIPGLLTPKLHSEIERQGDHVFITCHKQRPKLLINCQQVEEGRLWDGDVIEIGDLKMIFHQPTVKPDLL